MSISFWFDPSCPFTWRTSRWIRAAAQRHDETVQWRLMSLAILNEGRDIPEQYRAGMAWGSTALRVLAAVEEHAGQDGVERLYTAAGTRLHEQGAAHDGLIAAAVADAGLPAELADAANDSEFDKLVRASHDAGQARVGAESGSPITAIGDGPGFFGPVVVPVPGEDSGDRLFEALRLLSTVPEFSELKRSRNPF
jgi:hypothetical protein